MAGPTLDDPFELQEEGDDETEPDEADQPTHIGEQDLPRTHRRFGAPLQVEEEGEDDHQLGRDQHQVDTFIEHPDVIVLRLVEDGVHDQQQEGHAGGEGGNGEQ